MDKYVVEVYFMTLKVSIKPVNETIVNDMSIDELNKRIQTEDIGHITELWTCACDILCPCNVLCPHCPTLTIP